MQLRSANLLRLWDGANCQLPCTQQFSSRYRIATSSAAAQSKQLPRSRFVEANTVPFQATTDDKVGFPSTGGAGSGGGTPQDFRVGFYPKCWVNKCQRADATILVCQFFAQRLTEGPWPSPSGLALTCCVYLQPSREALPQLHAPDARAIFTKRVRPPTGELSFKQDGEPTSVRWHPFKPTLKLT